MECAPEEAAVLPLTAGPVSLLQLPHVSTPAPDDDGVVDDDDDDDDADADDDDDDDNKARAVCGTCLYEV